jgi:hypothetical protein
METMICPNCSQSQPQAPFCSFCYQRMGLPETSAPPSESPITPWQSPEETPTPTGVKGTLTLLGQFMAREIYFEDGVTAPRIAMFVAGSTGALMVGLETFAVLNSFWPWVIGAGLAAGWATHRLYREHYQALLNNTYFERSFDLEAARQIWQQNFLLWMLLFALGLGSLMGLNRITALFPHKHTTEVVQTWVRSGKSNAYYASFKPWKGHSQPIQIRLSRNEFLSLRTGSPVAITSSRGILGIERRLKLEILPSPSPQP